jgi:hypothetical protein
MIWRPNTSITSRFPPPDKGTMQMADLEVALEAILGALSPVVPNERSRSP